MHRGYGTFWNGEKNVRAHRYAWEFHHGPIPENVTVDHTCHNRACVNVDHLRLVTVTENNQYLAGAQSGSRSGVRNVHWHKATGRWAVNVICNGVNHYFGSYSTVDEAKVVAEKARDELFGKFAGKG